MKQHDTINPKRLAVIIGNILMIISFIFIINKIISFDIDFSFVARPEILLSIVGLIIVYCFFSCLGTYPFSWRLILTFISQKRFSYRKICLISSKSSLAKYVPGNIMHYVSRNFLGVPLGVSQSQLALSSILEIILTSSIAFFWVLILAGKEFWHFITDRLSRTNPVILSSLIIIIILSSIIVIYVLYRRKNHFPKYIAIFKSKEFLRLIVQLFLLYSITFLLFAFMLIVILRWSIEIGSSDILIIISAFILSWIAGLITPGAPGGIGVREAILIFMLTDVCGMEAILTAAVIQRLIIIFGDIAAYMVIALINKLKPS
jgi:hypothetical protein